MVQLFTLPAAEASSRLDARVGLSLLYLLVIPAFVPSTLAAYAVVGEREQGTLEPVLITPISREEFLVGKALAVAVADLAIGYAIFGIFLAAAKLFANPSSPRRSSPAHTSSSSCCSRRYSPAGRSGWGSRSRPARAISASPSS